MTEVIKQGKGYRQLHYWVEKTLGKPTVCSHCKEEKLPLTSGRRRVQWANVSGKYLQDVSDWIALCIPCHGKYDNYHINRRRGIEHGKSMLTEKIVRDIRSRAKAGEMYKNIARFYSIAPSNVRVIVIRKTWTHI